MWIAIKGIVFNLDYIRLVRIQSEKKDPEVSIWYDRDDNTEVLKGKEAVDFLEKLHSAIKEINIR